MTGSVARPIPVADHVAPSGSAELELGHHAELLGPLVEVAHERPRVGEDLVAEIDRAAGQRAGVGSRLEHTQPVAEHVGDRSAGRQLHDEAGGLPQGLHRLGEPAEVERGVRVLVTDVHVDHGGTRFLALFRRDEEFFQGDRKRWRLVLACFRAGRRDGDERARCHDRQNA